MQTIGERIRLLRTVSHLSMDQLAKSIYVPVNGDDSNHKPITSATVSNLENNKSKPSTDVAIALATFFNVSLDFLLTGEEFVQSKESIEIVKKVEKQYELNKALDELDDLLFEDPVMETIKSNIANRKPKLNPELLKMILDELSIEVDAKVEQMKQDLSNSIENRLKKAT